MIKELKRKHLVEEDVVRDWLKNLLIIEKQINALEKWQENLMDSNHPDELNYGHVGDLAYVREELSNVLEFLNIRIR